jgi:hypothetical protein
MFPSKGEVETQYISPLGPPRTRLALALNVPLHPLPLPSSSSLSVTSRAPTKMRARSTGTTTSCHQDSTHLYVPPGACADEVPIVLSDGLVSAWHGGGIQWFIATFKTFRRAVELKSTFNPAASCFSMTSQSIFNKHNQFHGSTEILMYLCYTGWNVWEIVLLDWTHCFTTTWCRCHVSSCSTELDKKGTQLEYIISHFYTNYPI